MKLELKKEELITLSNDDETLPRELTPQIGGGKNMTPEPTFMCSRWSCIRDCNDEENWI